MKAHTLLAALQEMEKGFICKVLVCHNIKLGELG